MPPGSRDGGRLDLVRSPVWLADGCRGIEQAREFRMVAMSQHHDHPRVVRDLARDREDKSLPGDMLQQVNNRGAFQSLVRRDRLLGQLNPLRRHVFQERAQLGVVQELVSSRFLPGARVNVQPVEFQVRDQVPARHRAPAPEPWCPRARPTARPGLEPFPTMPPGSGSRPLPGSRSAAQPFRPSPGTQAQRGPLLSPLHPKRSGAVNDVRPWSG